ncbi:MAG: PLP-dependent aminotransferase family protein [Bacteroidales bacterium]|nr:PLP-dependent aminotransferase family protein [Bacteroidales bacterium]
MNSTKQDKTETSSESNEDSRSSWRTIETNSLFADRISDVPKSFIREILKVTVSESIISFAGGLPNRDLFPTKALQDASNFVFENAGSEILQYSTTEGYLPLRKFIAERYALRGLEINPEDILITTGSQQGLDLLGKTFINEGDNVIIEEPGYLGAIQLFSVYRATFLPVALENDGLNIEQLKQVSGKKNTKLLYTVPNFSNPTGITYSTEKRKAVAEELNGKPIFIIEDDPYGDLRYKGENQLSFKHILPEQTILLGSFSKTVVPSFRIGWIVASKPIMDKLLVAKQASDLHTNYFTQRLLHQFLVSNSLDSHIKTIKEVYGRQAEAMVSSIKKYFPAEVSFTLPEGGMFLWVTLPKGISSMKLFDLAIKEDVAFVPGNPFYTQKLESTNTLRLNFSCVDEKKIEEGIKKLSLVIKKLLNEKL